MRAKRAQKGPKNHHVYRRNRHYRTSRRRCGTGRARRAGEGPLEEGRHPEERRAHGPEGGEEGQDCRPEGSRSPPAREQGRKGPGADQSGQGRQPSRTNEGHRLAGPQRPRVHQRHAGHQDGPQGGIRQTRGRRTIVLDGEVASPSPPSSPPGSGRGGLFSFWPRFLRALARPRPPWPTRSRRRRPSERKPNVAQQGPTLSFVAEVATPPTSLPVPNSARRCRIHGRLQPFFGNLVKRSPVSVQLGHLTRAQSIHTRSTSGFPQRYLRGLAVCN